MSEDNIQDSQEIAPQAEEEATTEAAPVQKIDQLPSTRAIDVNRIESDLHDVDAALTRLADGTYWTDEVTGQPIPDEVLARNPIARRAN